MSDLILNKSNTYIEICEISEEDLAGRVKIKMSSHLIHPDKTQWNKNGICWIEEYTQNNIKSAIGMDYVVSWADEENQIPSGHGNMSYDEEGNLQFDGVVVGSVQEAYITDIEIDGQLKKVMMTEGYINSQRYPLFVKWLREEIQNGRVHGSIEVNGKGKSKKIEYLDGDKNEDGTKKMGRIPVKFDFSGLAILSNIEEPADDDSIVFELNSKNQLKGGENLTYKKIKDGKEIEINELNYEDIACMITKAFNHLMNVDKKYDYYYEGYWIHKLYQSRAIMKKYDEPGCYYMVSFSINNSKIVLGDVAKAEEDWKPIEGETPVELNIEKLQEILSNNKDKEGELNMEYKEKYEALQKDYETMAKDKELMVKDMEEKNAKMSEINEALVNANKMMEETNAKVATMEEEMNGYKEKYEAMMAEKNAAEEEAEKNAKIAEVNSYFENEIIKNGFDETEINSLKSFVDAMDLNGLKEAERELCVKKFKELTSQNSDTELNTKNAMFITIKEKEKKEIKGTIPTFFN